MPMLIAAALIFLAIHLFVSGTKARDRLTAALGEGPYMGLFSLASVAGVVWLAVSYNAAETGPANRILYDLGIGVRHAAIPVVALAFFLGVQGLLMPSPTSVRGDSLTANNVAVKGVLRITRHPFLWGVVIWSAFHIAANGDFASVIFFGTFFLLALFGTASIDAKRRRKMGSLWEAFAAKTSNLPFAAIAGGRNQLRVGELFGWRFWAAAGIFAVMLFAHARLFHASPFPTGWVPF